MNKNMARATVATGLTAGLILSGVSGAFASVIDSSDPASPLQLPDTANIRVWGPTRANTAVEAVKKLEADGRVNGKQEIFVVSGGDHAFADPLALTGLSDALDAPVLMTEAPNKLSKAVADKIKDIAPARITIIGGNLSVTPEVESEIAGLVDNAIVTRIAGETRYDTAYILAAYTAAAYEGTSSYESLRDLRDNTNLIEAAEKAYMKALKDFEAARRDYAVEQDKLLALQEKVSAVLDKINAATADLKATGDSATLEAEMKRLKVVVDDAAKEVKAQTEANKFLTEVVSNLTEDSSTLNIKSTINDYLKHFADDEAKLKQLRDAVSTVYAGSEDNSTTIEKVISDSNEKLAEANDAFKQASVLYGRATAKMLDNADAIDANKDVERKIQGLYAEYEKLQGDLEKQAEVALKAYEKEVAAKEALAKAVLARPSVNDLRDARNDLAEAIDAAVAKAGKFSIFLADGTRFPDALVGGPAAAATKGIVLLSDYDRLPAATDKYLKASKAQVVTVGAPAAAAAKLDHAKEIKVEFSGETRYATAAAITKYYFQDVHGKDVNGEEDYLANKNVIAVASGEHHADAVLAANFIAQYDGGVLLTQRDSVPVPTLHYLDNLTTDDLGIRAFGGPIWISDGVLGTLKTYVK